MLTKGIVRNLHSSFSGCCCCLFNIADNISKNCLYVFYKDSLAAGGGGMRRQWTSLQNIKLPLVVVIVCGKEKEYSDTPYTHSWYAEYDPSLTTT